MHDVIHDHSPWFHFNHGCPKRPPEDEPYNTPFAVLGYTESGEPVFTIHTVEGETEEVNVKDKIIILKDTTYTIAADGTNLVLTDSDGNVQTVPVFESAEATTEQAGFMSATDKAKLDSLTNYSVATTSTAGLMSATDKTKLNSLSAYTEATTTTNGLMSASDKTKLNSLTNYSDATESSSGLMSSTDKAKLNSLSASDATSSQSGMMSPEDKSKLDGIEENAEENVIEGITLNGTAVEPAGKIVNLVISGGGSGGSGEANVIEVVKVNGLALTVTNKEVDISVPTQTSQLLNNSQYVTTSDMNTAISNAIGTAISSSY